MMIDYNPIGTIHTPFIEPRGMPIQPSGARGVGGTIEILPDYVEGLKDLEGFSHIILLYAFHRSSGYRLTVVPFMDSEPRGLFATRAPKRPNPIGLSVVKLVRIDGATLDIEDVDILDGTPLLDIKPYIPECDRPPGRLRVGWLEKSKGRMRARRSDSRFA